MMKTYAEKLFVLVGAGVGFFYGTDSTKTKLVYMVFLFICFDLFTGCLKAIYKKDGLKSHIFEMGLLKKVGIMISISFCYFMDSSGIMNFGVSLQSSISVAFMIGECISIIENLDIIGVKFPSFIKDYLIAKKDGEGDEVWKTK